MTPAQATVLSVVARRGLTHEQYSVAPHGVWRSLHVRGWLVSERDGYSLTPEGRREMNRYLRKERTDA